MTDPASLLSRLDELEKDTNTGSDFEVLRWVLQQLPGWNTVEGPGFHYRTWGDGRARLRWFVKADGALMPCPSPPSDLPTMSQEEALDDLLAMWVSDLTPTVQQLAFRWGWPEAEAAALVSTADGIATEWGIR